MSRLDDEGEAADLVLEYDLDAPPEKVWRALSIDAFRERWLPAGALAEPRPISCVPGEEVRYRMRDDEPPFLESVVTFRVGRDAHGGTRLTIIHGLRDARLDGRQRAANSNGPPLMRAA